MRCFWAAIVAASLMCSGCRRQHPHEDAHSFPLNDGQKALVASAMTHLQDQLSRHGCQSIYEDAGAGFRSQTAKNWLRDCERIEDDLGAWRDFQVEYQGYMSGIGARDLIVFVYGPAVFEKGNTQVEANFLVKEKGAQLITLSFREGGREWLIAPPRAPRLIDPPMRGWIDKRRAS